jgi:hypothetical protein
LYEVDGLKSNEENLQLLQLKFVDLIDNIGDAVAPGFPCKESVELKNLFKHILHERSSIQGIFKEIKSRIENVNCIALDDKQSISLQRSEYEKSKLFCDITHLKDSLRIDQIAADNNSKVIENSLLSLICSEESFHQLIQKKREIVKKLEGLIKILHEVEIEFNLNKEKFGVCNGKVISERHGFELEVTYLERSLSALQHNRDILEFDDENYGCNLEELHSSEHELMMRQELYDSILNSISQEKIFLNSELQFNQKQIEANRSRSHYISNETLLSRSQEQAVECHDFLGKLEVISFETEAIRSLVSEVRDRTKSVNEQQVVMILLF